MFNIKKNLVRISLVLSSLLTVTALTTSIAGASATSCTFYGTGIKGPIRNGQFCASVVGSGQYLSYVSGNFGTTIPNLDQVCNPSIKVDAYDRYSNWYGWAQGSQKYGCTWGTWNSVNTLYLNKCIKPNGFVIVTLQSYGTKVASIKFGIGSGGCSGGGGW